MQVACWVLLHSLRGWCIDSLDELTLWWCKNGHWLAAAFSTLKIHMPDTPNKGAVDANNAGLYSAEFPDALGKADTVPWRKKDRWRCTQQHYHTSWKLLVEHSHSAEEATAVLAVFLHCHHGGTMGQCWMLGLGCPGCPFLYSEHLWKELWIQMAFLSGFLSGQFRDYIEWCKSWPHLPSATMAWYVYSPQLGGPWFCRRLPAS